MPNAANMDANTINAFLLILPMVCYLGVCGHELYRNNPPLALTFFGYALGNVGLLWALWR